MADYFTGSFGFSYKDSAGARSTEIAVVMACKPLFPASFNVECSYRAVDIQYIYVSGKVDITQFDVEDLFI